MMDIRKNGFVFVGAIAGIAMGLMAIGVSAQECTEEGEDRKVGVDRVGDKGPRKPGGGGYGGGGREGMGEPLTEEERERVREVLAKVWQDPEVVAAKESVAMATEEYRDALKAAVLRVDPGAEELMARMHEKSRMMAMRKEHDAHRRRMFGGGGGGPLGPGLHEFLARLSDEERLIFMEARDKADQTEAVRVLREEMRAVEDPEERMKYMTRSRDLLLQEMVKIDERVKELLPRLQSRGGRPNGGGPGRAGGDGAGKKKGGGNSRPVQPEGEQGLSE
ncbi:MAG: hypothetical protein AAGD22_08665 [Verrucomicrobiota bacterium]